MNNKLRKGLALTGLTVGSFIAGNVLRFGFDLAAAKLAKPAKPSAAIKLQAAAASEPEAIIKLKPQSACGPNVVMGKLLYQNPAASQRYTVTKDSTKPCTPVITITQAKPAP